jgi:hypothetical protein
MPTGERWAIDVFALQGALNPLFAIEPDSRICGG